MANENGSSQTSWEPNGPGGELCIKSIDPQSGEVCYFPLLGYGNPVSDSRFDKLEMLQCLDAGERVVARLLCLWAVEGPKVEMFTPVPTKDISPELKGVRVPTGEPDPHGPFPPEEIASALKRAHELCPSIEARFRDLAELHKEFKKVSQDLPHTEISPGPPGHENPYLPRHPYITLDNLFESAILMLGRFLNELSAMPYLKDWREARATRKRAAWFFKRDAIAYALFRLLTEQATPLVPHMKAYALIGRFERDFLGRDIGYGTSGETETVRKQITDFKQSPRKDQMDGILDHLLAVNWLGQHAEGSGNSS